MLRCTTCEYSFLCPPLLSPVSSALTVKCNCNDYLLSRAGGKELGKGGFGVVKVVTNKQTGQKLAMKVSASCTCRLGIQWSLSTCAMIALFSLAAGC